MASVTEQIRSKFWRKGSSRTFEKLISIIEDFYFDLKYGTDTSGIVPVKDLDITHEEKTYSRRYQPTRIRYFKKLIEKLSLPEDSVFIDFGCGKGRVLFVASQYPFKRIVGIELSSQLCQIARKNLAAFEQKSAAPSRIEIVEGNVLNYDIHDDENVFYFFRPFDAPIMDEIIEKISASLYKNPRQVWIIICSSIYDELFEEKQLFDKAMDYAYGGAKFVVYVNDFIEAAERRTAVHHVSLS